MYDEADLDYDVTSKEQKKDDGGLLLEGFGEDDDLDFLDLKL
jgi:hypothetical protein